MTSESYTDLEIRKIEKECSDIFKRLKEYESLLNQQKELYAKARERLALFKKEKHVETSNRLITDAGTSIETWSRERYKWSESVETTLKTVFKLEKLRPVQLAAINATMCGKDVILVMPTGAGKSLIFQLSGVVESKITIVVSPLISLMDDQVLNIKRLNIQARALHSNLPKSESKYIRDQLKKDNCEMKFLYVSPEWLAKSKTFMQTLKNISKNIGRVVIDEVHCCSSWGHDFRPDYKYLGILRKTLKNTPFLGLTATATPAVLADIISIINLKDPVIMTQPINRPNLYYEIKPKPQSKSEITEMIAKYLTKIHPKECGIIYTNTVNECVSLVQDLKSMGITSTGTYYGNMEYEDKEIVHKKWIKNKIHVIVATNAFGMGIDKPDVRFVIHLGLPRSIESMYQESGRAGRDGNPADCLILYNLSDFLKLYGNATSNEEAEKHLSVLLYCMDQKTCRRVLLNKAFRDSSPLSCDKMCDHCRHPSKILHYYNLSKLLKDINSLLKHIRTVDAEANTTLKQLLDALYKKGPVKFRASNIEKPKVSTADAELMLSFLISRQYLGLERGFSLYNVNCYITQGDKDIPDVIPMASDHVLKGLEKVNAEHVEDDFFNSVVNKGVLRKQVTTLEEVNLDTTDEDDEGPSHSKIQKLSPKIGE